jgi:hypothetical protein
MLLFKKILDFKKLTSDASDKRGNKRYPVGSKFPIKAKLTLPGRDSEGNRLPAGRNSTADWGGQLADLSSSGANIRLHPAAVAEVNDRCCLMLELDNKLFEIDAAVAHFRTNSQHAACGIILRFADSYSRKAYLQLMEPMVIGSSLEPVVTKVTQDRPGLLKQLFQGEPGSELKVWRDEEARNPRHFELIIHDYHVRGSTEFAGLQIGYRDGAKVGRRVSRPSIPIPMSADHQDEVRRLFQFIVQNLGKGVPADVRKFLELFAA